MNKLELASRVAEKVEGLTKKTAIEIVEATFQVINEALVSGEEVSIAGHGKYTVKETPARVGRNPKTGEEVKIPASKKVKFRAAKQLKDRVK